jgi:hydroxymethylpyrimidine/phosphomethylpyrimidine kinase
VLHKGGHGDGALAIDTLHTARERHCFERPRLATGPVRGTGCALASAIAARLANGQPLAAACRPLATGSPTCCAELARTPGAGCRVRGVPCPR